MRTNAFAARASCAISVVIGLLGFAGLALQPKVAVSTVFAHPDLVYGLVILLNLPILFLAPVLLKKLLPDHMQLAENIFCGQMMITQLMGVFSVFSTQAGSSLYIEAMLIMLPVPALSSFPLYRDIINYSLTGAVFTGIFSDFSASSCLAGCIRPVHFYFSLHRSFRRPPTFLHRPLQHTAGTEGGEPQALHQRANG